MVELIEGFQDRYLTLLSECLSDIDKDKFLEAKKHVESVDCSEESLRRYEKILSDFVEEFGHLILHRDLLSIAAAENAIKLRKTDILLYRLHPTQQYCTLVYAKLNSINLLYIHIFV